MKKDRLFLSPRLVPLVFIAAAGLAHAQPTYPTVSTLPASAVSGTSATLNGTADPVFDQTIGFFQWGTTTNYGNNTPAQSLGNGIGNTNFSQVIGSLSSAVTYHFRAVASNSSAIVFGTNQSFTTTPFSEIGAGLPGVYYSSVAWGDYDNDGRLDILLTGTTNSAVSGKLSQVWRNTGNGFTNVNAGLERIASSAAWGDYDNDGRLDILLSGAATNGLLTQLWRNTGGGFSNINAGLPGAYYSSVSWGDYDNDGRRDILLTGATNGAVSMAVSQVWRNTGSGFVDINAGLPGVAYSSAAWGDYDNDGRLDILVTGTNVLLGGAISQVWRNTGSGFTNIVAGLPGVSSGSVAWGDYDNDGRLDILLTGTTNGAYTGAISQVWRNTGSGFTNIAAGLPGVAFSSAAWGDHDNDGRLDILFSGSSTIGVISQLWRNTGGGFTNINAGLPGVLLGSVAWGDYDSDGRLDILLTGTTNSLYDGARICQVWRNNTPQNNSPPTAPSSLNLTVSNSTATLTWSASADAATPAPGLNYNVRIGTTPGGSDVMAPMAGANGLRRLPQLGNAQSGLTAIFNFMLGTKYYWSVQAVDNAFAGSAFSTEGSFTILPQLNIALAGAGVTLSWTPPISGWVLQERTNLSTGAWSNSPSGGLNPVIIPHTTSANFFRLFKP